MKLNIIFLSFLIVLFSFNFADARWVTICNIEHHHKHIKSDHKKHHKKKHHKKRIRKHIKNNKTFPLIIPNIAFSVSSSNHMLTNIKPVNNIPEQPYVYEDIFKDIDRPLFFGLYGNGGYSKEVLENNGNKFSYIKKEKVHLEHFEKYHNNNFDYDTFNEENKGYTNSWNNIISSVLSYSINNEFVKQFNKKHDYNDLVCKSIWIPEPPNPPAVPEPKTLILIILGLFVFLMKKVVDKRFE